MACYMVSYDLRKRKDYPELWDALKKYNYWHCLDSTWILKVSNSSSKQIADSLLKHIDADDLLLVNLLSSESAWTVSFSKECQDWLRNNL